VDAAVVIDGLLEGAVDLHCHPAPSPFPRRVDAVEAARHYAEAGFSAVVMKSHHHSTVMDVLALGRHGLDELPVKVCGGIALNGPVGGLNPRAVDLCLKMGGRIVWFPTIASANHIEHHSANPDLKFPALSRPLMHEAEISVFDGDGQLRDEVHEILALIRDEDAILASGHMAPDQVFAVFRAARDIGVRRLLVNHPNFVLGVSHQQARELAALGAYVEHSLCMYDDRSTFYNWPLDVLLEWIKVVGPERTTLGSDLGQDNNPLPVESFQRIGRLLLEAGVPEADVRRMVRDNPAALLGVLD
jgi:hypothetical protein